MKTLIKREAKEKLYSQKGASLSITLLLFLVCATVGSVILVAGTTASGRMSQITTLDQRYYCVSSAADLLNDSIHNIPVKVTRTRTYTKTMSYTEDVDTHTTTHIEESGPALQSDVTVIEWGSNSCTVSSTYTGGSLETRVEGSVKSSIIADAAQKLIETSVVANDYANTYPSAPLSGRVDRNLELTTNKNRDDLEADITEIIGSEGNITLYVSNRDNSQKYSLQLIFRRVNDEPVEATTSTTPGAWSSSGNRYYKTDTIRKVETTEVRWILKSIKNMAIPSATVPVVTSTPSPEPTPEL